MGKKNKPQDDQETPKTGRSPLSDDERDDASERISKLIKDNAENSLAICLNPWGVPIVCAELPNSEQAQIFNHATLTEGEYSGLKKTKPLRPGISLVPLKEVAFSQIGETGQLNEHVKTLSQVVQRKEIRNCYLLGSFNPNNESASDVFDFAQLRRIVKACFEGMSLDHMIKGATPELKIAIKQQRNSLFQGINSAFPRMITNAGHNESMAQKPLYGHLWPSCRSIDELPLDTDETPLARPAFVPAPVKALPAFGTCWILSCGAKAYGERMLCSKCKEEYQFSRHDTPTEFIIAKNKEPESQEAVSK